MGKEINNPRMAPRAKNGTASSINGEHTVPNKEQSLVFRIPRDLSLIAKLYLILCSRFQQINKVFYTRIDRF